MFRTVTAIGEDSSLVEGESHYLVLLAAVDSLSSSFFQKEPFCWQKKEKGR